MHLLLSVGRNNPRYYFKRHYFKLPPHFMRDYFELSTKYNFLVYVALLQIYMSQVEFFIQLLRYRKHANSDTMSRVYPNQQGTIPQ